MSTLEHQHLIHRAQIMDIRDKILSGVWQVDGLCRLLALARDMNTPADLKLSLESAYNWIKPCQNVRRCVAELAQWL